MRQKTVLIIDDDPDIHAMLKKRLEHHGLKCASSMTVESALSNLLRIKPDLVLLDLGFPDEDGGDFLQDAKTILSSKKFKVPPIIILSAVDDEATIRKMLDKGAAGFITKPYDPIKLLDLIDDSLDGEEE